MELKVEMSLSEIVKKYPSAAALFEKFDLDYCCHGKQTLEQACEGDLVKYGKVNQALRQVALQALSKNNLVHFENMEINELLDHIINKHHHYVKESMPVIYA